VKKKMSILWPLMLVLGVVLMSGGCGSGVGTDLTGQVNFNRMVGRWVVQPDTFTGLVSIGDGENASSFSHVGGATLTGEIVISHVGRTHNPRRGEGTVGGTLRFDADVLCPINGWTLFLGRGGAPAGATFGSNYTDRYYIMLEGGAHIDMLFDARYRATGEPLVVVGGRGADFSVNVDFRVRRQ